jgi:hypothetical protein
MLIVLHYLFLNSAEPSQIVGTKMASKDGYPGPPYPLRGGQDNEVTADLLKLMERDLVFAMRFMGESQYRLQSHFQDFIMAELSATGVTQASHPMIHAFVERHAIVLRDFVFSGVSLSRQIRVEELERLTGDTMIRVDIWDQLQSHINMAEKQFRTQLSELPTILEAWKTPEPTKPRGRE